MLINPGELKVIPRKRTPEKVCVAIRELYAAGNSTREIGKAIGCSSSFVSEVCRSLSRSKAESIRLRANKEPRSAQWRTARGVARRIMEAQLGRKLQPNEVVHHINGDYTDQHLENLEVMSRGDHGRLHHTGRKRPRTHCLHGHPLTSDNSAWEFVKLRGKWERYCRLCRNAAQRRRYRAKIGVVNAP